MVMGDLNLPSSFFVVGEECGLDAPSRMAPYTEPVSRLGFFWGLTHWLSTVNDIVLDLGLLSPFSNEPDAFLMSFSNLSILCMFHTDRFMMSEAVSTNCCVPIPSTEPGT